MYLLDANVFIDAKNRYYAFDIVPAFWDWLAAQHQARSVLTVQAVHDEIIGGGDDLAAWMRSRPASFRLAPTAADTASLATLSAWAQGQNYTQAAVSTFLGSADYFLVAQALTSGHTVVTHETAGSGSTKRVKIPDACAAMGVACVNPFQWLRNEGAKFA